MTSKRAKWLLAICVSLLGAAASQEKKPASDEELAKRVEKVDKALLSALESLAGEFDRKKDAEAAHFFAELAVGLGSPKADEMKKLRDRWECAVYLGTEGGAKPLKDGASIEKRLEGARKEFKEIVDALVELAKAKKISDVGRKLLQACVVKYELSRGAAEYIHATKRFNELRRAMKLRPILWDWERSRAAILAAWYIAETGDSSVKPVWRREHHAYTSEGETSETNRLPDRYALPDTAESVRSFALIRLALLKPDARRLWLGHWVGGSTFKMMTCYNIPDSQDDRCPVPTPSDKYERGTVAEEWNAWKDLEETITIGGKKVIVVHYPYAAEKDSPYRFGDKTGETGILAPDYENQVKLGVPLSVMFYSDGLTIADASVKLVGKGGIEIPCDMYLPGDKRLKNGGFGWPGLLAIPSTHLNAGEEYTVTVKCKVADVPWEKTWRFTTRK